MSDVSFFVLLAAVYLAPTMSKDAARVVSIISLGLAFGFFLGKVLK